MEIRLEKLGWKLGGIKIRKKMKTLGEIRWQTNAKTIPRKIGKKMRMLGEISWQTNPRKIGKKIRTLGEPKK